MVTLHRGNASRLEALDVARALAIIGMIIVNVGPFIDDGITSFPVRSLNGRAAILFVLLAGIGVSFLARRTVRNGITLRSALLWRALFLLLLGLGLQRVDHDVNVILPTYAALFLLAIGFVHMPRWGLLTAALAAISCGPVLWILSRQFTQVPTEATQLGDSIRDILLSVIVSGPYPLLVWVAPFLLGIWLGRLPLHETRIQRRLIVSGTVATVAGLGVSQGLIAVLGEPNLDQVGWDRLVSAAGHSQMPLWMLSSTGSAVLILGVLLVVVPRLGRGLSALSWMGRMPLTAYTGHLLLIAVLLGGEAANTAQGLGISAAVVVILLLFCGLWSRWFRDGPLEYLLRQLPAALRLPQRVQPRHGRRRAKNESDPHTSKEQ